MRTEKERALDAYLAAAARVGDRHALGHLARRWQPKLLAHAIRLTGERDLAADVVQDAWTEILLGLDGLRDVEAFPAWAFRIVSRRCAKTIRGRQRIRAGNEALAHASKTGGATPLDGAVRSDLALVRRTMQSLPRDQRAALGLFYLEGLRVAEIAVALDVPAGTVKTRLMHARKKLRTQLEGDET